MSTHLDSNQKQVRYNYNEITMVDHLNLDREGSIDYMKKASSTPLASSSRTITTTTFKLTPHKQSNHSRLKNQTSPYYNHHIGKLNNTNSNNNNNNNSSCSSSVSNSSHSFLQALNTSLNTSSTDESQNLSTKTNPPTTPVQFHTPSNDGICETTSPTSSPPTSPTTNNCVRKRGGNEIEVSILYVTPASTTSPSVTHVSDSSKTTTTTTSNSVQPFSRSSSYTSLSSCDLKSTYSSVQSEYTTGFHTPYSSAAYSELPNSPGDQMDYFINNTSNLNNNFNIHNKNSNCNSAQKQDELSMITVDSNPSKSNDITIIERTILANSNSFLTHQSSTHSSGGYNGKQLKFKHKNGKSLTSSAYNSESNSFLVNNGELNNEDDDEEKVVSYEMEGSICGSTTRSNVSCLTFPNEPVADITFIRNLLARKSQDVTKNEEELDQFLTSMNESIQSIIPQPKQKWSVSNKQFTPPVKLPNASNTVVSPIITVNTQLNRSLFHNKKKLTTDEDFDKESIKYYNVNEHETCEDDACSVLSVPSEIRFDRCSQNLEKSNFSALIKKLSTPPPSKQTNSFQLPLKKNILNVTFTKDNDSSLTSSPFVNGSVPVWSTAVNNTMLDESITNFNNNNYQEQEEDDKHNYEGDDGENDKRILYEFIDEMFSKSNGENLNNNPTEFDESNVSENENQANFANNYSTEESDGDTDDDLSQLSSILRQKQPSTRIQQQQMPPIYIQELPKIDEDIEEESDQDNKHFLNRQMQQKPHATSHQTKTLKTKDVSSKPVPFIQMTRTARLRFDKLSQDKYITVDSCKKKQTVANSNFQSKTVYTKFLVKENMENKQLPWKTSTQKPPVSSSSNASFNFNNKSKQQSNKKASFSTQNTNMKQSNLNSTSKNSTEATENNKSSCVYNVSNLSNKTNTVLTTVNFHSNTFNFNYKS